MTGFIIFLLVVVCIIFVMWGVIEWGQPFYVFSCFAEFMLEACADD